MQNERVPELVRAAAHGDDAAFALLVECFERMTVAIAYGWLGDRELAREAAQEAFLDAHQHLDQLREPAAFPGWLRRIVVKHCDRATRRRQLQTTVLDSAMGIPARDAGPHEAVERAQKALGVRRVVERLPVHERLVVVLHYLSGYSLTEVAECLEVPLSTVKKRAHSARRRLREEIVTMIDQSLGTSEPTPMLGDDVRLHLAIRRGDDRAAFEILTRREDLVEVEERWSREQSQHHRLPYAAHGTPLVRAAEFGRLAIVRWLIEAGADINRGCGCAEGESPLWSAVAAGSAEVARCLLEHGADPDARAFGQRTGLHVAAMRGRGDLVDMLLEHGADRSLVDDQGLTPGAWAARTGHAELAARLHAKGSPPESVRRDTRRESPLFETGIRAIDLFAPLPRGALVEWAGSYGLGQLVLMSEIARRATAGPASAVHWLGFEQMHVVAESELMHMLDEAGVTDRAAHHVALVPGRLPEAERREAFEDVWARFSSSAGGVLFLFAGEGHMTDIEQRLAEIARRDDLLATFIATPWSGGEAAPVSEPLAAPLDARIVLDPLLARAHLYPAIHPLCSTSRAFESVVSERHRHTTAAARQLLAAYRDLDPDLICMAPSTFSGAALDTAVRAQELMRYLAQPFLVAEPFTGVLGEHTPLREALDRVEAIIER